ncbi:MAG TPA: VOC family protein [Bacteroidales bacterium]|jgi:Predicted enzyme related to lactoylglutathione lyase
MKHLINWVEIPVIDLKRAIGFYSKILGVEFNEMEIGGSRYAIFPTDDRFNSGALAQGEYYKPNTDGITIYLDGGTDLSIILSKVKAAGGEVIMEKIFLAKEAGYIGMFIDTEGNKIGLQHM